MRTSVRMESAGAQTGLMRDSTQSWCQLIAGAMRNGYVDRGLVGGLVAVQFRTVGLNERD